ncbi:hypothetical protein [Thermosyntropha sp.]|uniref:hypothetical protein n=1 Tax=Thermosyntropha sp. TaxID=2740820 RepID=UPI0025F8FA39|nr:hypothetical protein [Thermosyntropha sp.]MBO8159596.1 hypothetical protein [Thermosyntropha sp.]
MKKKWGKGDPVNLSDLLKITPVANEIMQLSKELEMNPSDIMWIVNQIIDNAEDGTDKLEEGINLDEDIFADDFDDIEIIDDDWEDDEENDLEEVEFEDSLRNSLSKAAYMVNVKVSGEGRFPEIAFKAGVNDKEDISYFFDMVIEMLDKLE